MRWLVTGATGLLGGHLLRELRSTAETVIAWSGSQQTEVLGFPVTRVDLAHPPAITAAFREAAPEVIIHAAAVARVDECRREPDKARRINTEGSRRLAELTAECGGRLIYVSTDLVFDGQLGNYREDDESRPLTVYGRTKADGETAVLTFPRTAAARLSLLYGRCLTGRTSFFDRMVVALREGRSITLFADEWRTPLDLPTAAKALIELARSEVTGRLHIGGPERLSRFEMGQKLADALGVSGGSIVAAGRNDTPGKEPRPRDTSLDSSRWRSLFPGLPWPNYRHALAFLVGRPA
jgi:dTDP-4-dehydrorhamnose reductase